MSVGTSKNSSAKNVLSEYKESDCGLVWSVKRRAELDLWLERSSVFLNLNSDKKGEVWVTNSWGWFLTRGKYYSRQYGDRKYEVGAPGGCPNLFMIVIGIESSSLWAFLRPQQFLYDLALVKKTLASILYRERWKFHRYHRFRAQVLAAQRPGEEQVSWSKASSVIHSKGRAADGRNIVCVRRFSYGQRVPPKRSRTSNCCGNPWARDWLCEK